MMASTNPSNWMAAAAFNSLYISLPHCVNAVVKEFGRRQRTLFVILRHRINGTWAMMPWSQWRKLDNSHPANPSTICFFGTFNEFRQICLAFPPDLFTGLPDSDAPEADPDIPPIPKPPADLDQADTTEKADGDKKESPLPKKSLREVADPLDPMGPPHGDVT